MVWRGDFLKGENQERVSLIDFDRVRMNVKRDFSASTYFGWFLELGAKLGEFRFELAKMVLSSFILQKKIFRECIA